MIFLSQEQRAGLLPGVKDSQPQPPARRESLVRNLATNTRDLRRFAQEPLRILHVFTRLAMGGTEYGILRVFSGLANQQFQHRLCTLRGFDEDLVRRHKLADKVFVAGRADENSQFAVFRLMAIMRSYRPHIVHSRNWGAIEAIPAARLAGVPVVIHSEHGYELDVLAALPLRRRLLRRFLYPLTDVVFTVTRELQHYHGKQAWVSPDHIRVIYNGVDTERFSPSRETRARMRQELGLSDSTFVVGAVGRTVPIKDHLTLLRAAHRLARENLDVHVLLIGSGPEKPRLEQFVRDSVEMTGRVSFLGSCDNVADLLQAMEVFVLPSICEGFSNTLLEAMASGLATISTRVGGNPEVIEEGRSGWLFSPGDSEELAGQLTRLSTRRDLRTQLGDAARARAVSRFALQRMLDDYRDLYCELAYRRGVLQRVS